MMLMASRSVLLSALALVTCPAAEARAAAHVARASIIRANVASLGEHLLHVDPKEKPEKKMEDPITIMRGELCVAREKLVGHAECMEWLVEECTTHSFGTGLCNRVGKHVKEECEEEHEEEACHYAKLLGIDIDTDGDVVPDKEDAFPEDKKETKDTDGDGVGDNEDDYPNDPKCQKKPCPKPTTTTPAPAMAPAPAPATAAAPATPEPKKEPAPAPKAATEAPVAYETPDATEGLQSQGFSGKKVLHVDGETVVGDWRNEYGHEPKSSKHTKSSSTRLWQPHALLLAAAALTLACAA